MSLFSEELSFGFIFCTVMIYKKFHSDDFDNLWCILFFLFTTVLVCQPDGNNGPAETGNGPF